MHTPPPPGDDGFGYSIPDAGDDASAYGTWAIHWFRTAECDCSRQMLCPKAWRRSRKERNRLQHALNGNGVSKADLQRTISNLEKKIKCLEAKATPNNSKLKAELETMWKEIKEL